MIRPIVKDTMFLSQKAEKFEREDAFLITDLEDTLKANSERCVGMAANMIGYNKAAIIVDMPFGQLVMLNPQIIERSGRFEVMEGCLSLKGERKAVRFQSIEVKYQDKFFKWQRQKFSGFTAQIIQHECDHLQGIII